MEEFRPRRANRPRGRRQARRQLLTAALYLFGLVAAGLLVAGAMVWLRSRPTPVPPEVEILRAGQAVIRRYLSPDVKTTFSDLNESTLELLSDG